MSSFANATDLKEWHRFGDVAYDEYFKAIYLSNNALNGDDFTFDHALNLSGNPAIDDIEHALKLKSKALDKADKYATEGSAIRTQLTVKQPKTISFDWTFFTDEINTGSDDAHNDYAFIAINGKVMTLVEVSTIRSPQAADFYKHKTSGHFEKGLPTGIYDIAIGVIDLSGDPHHRFHTDISSALRIKNFAIRRNTR